MYMYGRLHMYGISCVYAKYIEILFLCISSSWPGSFKFNVTARRRRRRRRRHLTQHFHLGSGTGYGSY